jgi:hypothetical protein
MNTTVSKIIDRARAGAWPTVVAEGVAISGEGAWRSRVPKLSPPDLASVERQLAEIEERAARIDACTAEYEARQREQRTRPVPQVGWLRHRMPHDDR